MAAWRSSLGNATDRLGSAAKRASGAVASCVPPALKGAASGAGGGAVVGALAGAGVAAAEGVVLGAFGFTALGPAAGSYAAGWMSSIALANGVGVSAGSLYAAAQAAAMGGTALLGAPFVIGVSATCAAVVAVACYKQGGGGEAPGGDAIGPDNTTNPESSSVDEATEPEQNVGDHSDDELLGQ